MKGAGRVVSLLQFLAPPKAEFSCPRSVDQTLEEEFNKYFEGDTLVTRQVPEAKARVFLESVWGTLPTDIQKDWVSVEKVIEQARETASQGVINKFMQDTGLQ